MRYVPPTLDPATPSISPMNTAETPNDPTSAPINSVGGTTATSTAPRTCSKRCRPEGLSRTSPASTGAGLPNPPLTPARHLRSDVSHAGLLPACCRHPHRMISRLAAALAQCLHLPLSG